jgi:hypothetical protein
VRPRSSIWRIDMVKNFDHLTGFRHAKCVVIKGDEFARM